MDKRKYKKFFEIKNFQKKKNLKINKNKFKWHNRGKNDGKKWKKSIFGEKRQ